MKHLMWFAGLGALLVSCGSNGSASDGSGSGKIIDVRTEYTTSGTAPYTYVGCDFVSNADDLLRENATQVLVDFELAGNLQSVEVQLRGTTSSGQDGNFKKTLTRNQLTVQPDGSYRVIFDADASIGELLPASIIVRPNEPVQPLKRVSSTQQQVGSFYAVLIINTGTDVFRLTSLGLRSIPVYRSCTVEATLEPLSAP